MFSPANSSLPIAWFTVSVGAILDSLLALEYPSNLMSAPLSTGFSLITLEFTVYALISSISSWTEGPSGSNPSRTASNFFLSSADINPALVPSVTGKDSSIELPSPLTIVNLWEGSS